MGLSTRNSQLSTVPPWQAGDVGKPIPGSIHSVSVALPMWDHVVGYEEKRPDVMRKLESGYPRFVIHPLVRELVSRVCADGESLPFPSQTTAEAAANYIRHAGSNARVVPARGVWVVNTTAEAFPFLKAFWQHTGVIVSTRQASAWLAQDGNAEARPTDSHEELRRVLAGFYDCDPSDVFLSPTGMAAQHAALQVLKSRKPGLPTVQLGFPYVDTLKLQQKLGAGGVLLHNLDTLPSDLAALAERQQLAGCFCEIPGNPLLGSADLQQIRPVLKNAGLPLVLDDVVATPFNIDVSAHADLIATSLTKFIAGHGEVMGGALICNPRSPFYAQLKRAAQAQHEELLWQEDAEVILQAARGFPDRMRRHNTAGLLIAERLRAHPAVDKVWYPKWEFSEAYEHVRRPDGGYGALVTFMPRNGEITSPQIYDRLQFCKGPSLGTTFTLACPFTLLAHYTELDWAESCGVSRYLIRLSVGLEDPEQIWSTLAQALVPQT